MTIFSPGDQVRSRADPGRIGVVRSVGANHGGVQYYSVFWGGPAGTRTVAEQDLVRHEESSSPTGNLIEGYISGYHDFQRVLTFQRLRREQPLRNNIYAFNASRTRFYPYQFKPLIKFLDSPNHRLLICDEVGLGKTIEAGLILTELRARRDLRTVLVVCPSGLTEKWRSELRRRFGEEFRVLRAGDLGEYLDDVEDRTDRPQLNGIASYETVRGARVLPRLEDLAPPIDLLIVDEAHHMRNAGTLTRKAGVLLASNADAVILLTATPVHLGNENLFSLLNLLDEEDFPDRGLAELRFRQNEPIVMAQRLVAQVPPALRDAERCLREAGASPWLQSNPLVPRVLREMEALLDGGVATKDERSRHFSIQRDLSDLNLLGHLFTRTRRRDVHLKVPVRRAAALEITFSPVEHAFYDAITEYVRAHGQARQQLPVVVQWRINSIQRRAASSLAALVEFYRPSANGTGPGFGDDEDLDSEEFDDAGAVHEAWNAVAELISRWPRDTPDSKYDRLCDVIAGLPAEAHGSKLIVFAFFKETLKYLFRRLTADGFECVLLHGDVPPEERGPLIDRFRDDPGVKVLLSSRVGSEGLDFQFCQTVVNYDLPWNPMEVEQRIGRVDRIGQTASQIHIFNLWTLGTIEERILRRLYDRIGVFERSIGSLDTIVGDVMRQLERSVLSRNLTPQEQEAEALRVERVLDHELRHTEELESDAARFIGLDEFFTEEVNAIRTNRRYVTGQQLRLFIEDFLRERAPSAKLRYDAESRLGSLVPDADLRRFLQDHGKAGDAFVVIASGPDGVEITFDSEMAFERPRIEFLNVLHPLVQAIVQFYAATGRERAAAHHVALATHRLSAGMYLFFVYRLTAVAARPRSTLECLILDDSLRLAAEGSEAEVLLGEMVEAGFNSPGGTVTLERDYAVRAVGQAERYFVASQAALRETLIEENDGFVERRLASLRTSYRKNIDRVRQRRRVGEQRERQERYLRMLRGQEARLETELRQKEQELQALRGIQLEHTEVAAGILEIVAP